MAKSKTGSVNRRGFLKSAGVTAAALVANPAPPVSAATEAPQEPARNATAPVVTRDAETGRAPIAEAIGTDRPGSDFMVDVFKSMDFEFLCSNPANSFRSLHESIINHGGNKSPEFITCNHEEIAVAMAHGYAKIEGKPALVAVHGTVGLQHASMAIYDAFCDRVPVYIVLGNILDASRRRGVVDWAHSVQDATAMVREFVKWDDVPMSLPHFAESAARAYKIAMTPPMMPVALVLDKDLQERPITETLRLPKLTTAMPPQGDQGSVNEAARMLVAAESPVIVAGRLARTPAGLAHLIELAEALQAPVIDQKERMNFPTHHTLNHTERTRPILTDADVILGLEVTDFSGMRSNRPAAKRISITANDLYTKNNYQDVQRYAEVDLAMAADAEATLPALVEAVRRLTTADRKRYFQDRGSKLATSFQQAQETMREAATYGWDASPISTARVSAELWQQIKTEDWSLVADVIFFSNWPLRLWKMDKHYHYIGGPGGFGVGYGLPAAVGAAAANKKHGRLTVNIQNDGDFMFAPGSLWTAAHHRIPLLTIMHNNRAYHQEVMEVQRIALQHNRGITHADIGNKLINPEIDYAKMAQSMGVHGEGPISNPKDLGPAIKRAIEVVKRGEPALVDVLTQPR
jgi:thiamine pyrophosphate-dependent acetolactate synthase large subunit-like protein